MARDYALAVLAAVALLSPLGPAEAKLRLRDCPGDKCRTEFHVVGMVPFPGPVFVRKYRPALSDYLTQEVGTKFDPPIKFTIRFEDAYAIEPFDDPLANKRDFTFTYPNMAGCLEAEFLKVPLTTVRNYRGGKELNHYGGVVYALKDREDLKSITDLKDKVVTASNFKLCQHQWRVFDDAGVSLMADTKQVRFSAAGEDALIADVLNGESDAAFTRTDAIEDYTKKHPVDGAKLKILSPVKPQPILDGETFPFETTSELYPEYAVLADTKLVEWQLQREVLTALLKLTTNDTVCDDKYYDVDKATGKKGDEQYIVNGCKEGVNATGHESCVKILCNAQIASFQPALSYGPARDLFQTLGLMTLDTVKRRWRCVRAKETWDGIACPAGMFKLSRAEVEGNCEALQSTCPPGYTCLCKPCKRAKEVDIVPQPPSVERRSSGLALRDAEARRQSEAAASCEKMKVCGSALKQKDERIFRLADNRLRPEMKLTWTLREGSGTREGTGAPVKVKDEAGVTNFDYKYQFSITSKRVGVHILQIMFDGVEVPTSPVLLQVDEFDCGDNTRTADQDGDCVCNAGNGYIAVAGGRCMKSAVLGVIIALPIVLVLLLAGWLYIKIKTKMADSIWEVQLKDLIFDSPPEVLGRGTFGLVVAATYNTTRVAVKRVIPSKKTPKSKTKFLDELFEIKSDNDNLSLTSAESGMSGGTNPDVGRTASWVAGDRAQDSVDQFRSKNSSGHATGSGYATGSRRTILHSLCPCLYPEHVVMREHFIEEMRYLSKMRHPCITTVMGAVVASDSEPMLVMECMEHGSLYDLIHNYTLVLEGEIVIPILQHVCQGLAFLHAATLQVIHGDLKAANVLVDSKFRAKVADFGLTAKQTAGACGTPFWMAPELILGTTLNTVETDIYAFGMTVWEVYARADPYGGEDGGTVIAAVADLNRAEEKRPVIPKDCPAEVASIIRACWQNTSSQRPRFQDLERRLKSLDVNTSGPGGINKRENTEEAKVLFDVFPRHIAEKLMAGQRELIQPESRECVTIFFSDIVGFTDISAQLDPMRVSDMLHRLYTVFDALSTEHQVFKVETIGDAYMAVTNLVDYSQNDDHALRIAHFAIHAIEAANSTLIDPTNPDLGTIQIRVGFHSGPVVANVVGSRNPRYCLFGDTVNTASRMESTSVKGKIQCSERSAKILMEQLRTSGEKTIKVSSRGEMPIKGKGKMNTYFVGRGDAMPAASAIADPSNVALSVQPAAEPAGLVAAHVGFAGLVAAHVGLEHGEA